MEECRGVGVQGRRSVGAQGCGGCKGVGAGVQGCRVWGCRGAGV